MSAAARDYALTRSWERALEPLFDTYRRLHQTQPSVVPAVVHAA